jgi:hypothetical protein
VRFVCGSRKKAQRLYGLTAPKKNYGFLFSFAYFCFGILLMSHIGHEMWWRVGQRVCMRDAPQWEHDYGTISSCLAGQCLVQWDDAWCDVPREWIRLDDLRPVEQVSPAAAPPPAKAKSKDLYIVVPPPPPLPAPSIVQPTTGLCESADPPPRFQPMQRVHVCTFDQSEKNAYVGGGMIVRQVSTSFWKVRLDETHKTRECFVGELTALPVQTKEKHFTGIGHSDANLFQVGDYVVAKDWSGEGNPTIGQIAILYQYPDGPRADVVWAPSDPSDFTSPHVEEFGVECHRLLPRTIPLLEPSSVVATAAVEPPKKKHKCGGKCKTAMTHASTQTDPVCVTPIIAMDDDDSCTF